MRAPAVLWLFGLAACGSGPPPRHEPPLASPTVAADAVAVADADAVAVADAGAVAVAVADADAVAVAVADAGTDATLTAPRPGWVDVATVIPDAVLDIRYATANNFTGAPLYPVARCLLRTHVAEQLAVAAATLRQAGHRLLLWDCYRPASIQTELWRRVPDPAFVARPAFDDAGRPTSGSKHSRGAAVDLGLADPSGAPRELPTDHDAFGPAASGARATGAARANHRTLRAAMRAAGFSPLATEWWHYDAGDWRAYSLSDDPL